MVLFFTLGMEISTNVWLKGMPFLMNTTIFRASNRAVIKVLLTGIFTMA
jgi:hypothetical protein